MEVLTDQNDWFGEPFRIINLCYS
uniref:Uncharacterized protein n=1 Tax=Arundo donax TaxID=35708 RepID=A0A0A8ZYU7_ARUDO